MKIKECLVLRGTATEIIESHDSSSAASSTNMIETSFDVRRDFESEDSKRREIAFEKRELRGY